VFNINFEPSPQPRAGVPEAPYEKCWSVPRAVTA